MTSAINRLMSRRSAPLGPGTTEPPEALAPLLARADGFYAFDSALHVRPSGAGPGARGWWNRDALWKGRYPADVGPHLCFAEDAFGNQFTIFDGTFFLLDAETAHAEPIASTVEEWAAALLADPAFLLGHDCVVAWQEEHGRLAHGERLVPRQPFALGGERDVSNLQAVRDVDAMLARAAHVGSLRGAAHGAAARMQVVTAPGPSRLDERDLAQRVKAHELSEAELEQLAGLISDHPDDPRTYGRLNALGWTGRAAFAPVVERFLECPRDPMLSRLALLILVRRFDVGERYADDVLAFCDGVEWDHEEDVRVLALSCAGAVAQRSDRRPAILASLLRTMRESDDRQSRDLAYASALQALGRSEEAVAAAGRMPRRFEDLEPALLAEIEAAIDG